MQPAFGAKAALEPPHPPAVGRVVVIVTDQVEEAVQGQDLQFLTVGMPRLARLAAGAPGRDGDVGRRERQHVRDRVRAAEPPVQRADAEVADERNREFGGRIARRDAPEPGRKPWRGRGPPAAVRDGDPDSAFARTRIAARYGEISP